MSNLGAIVDSVLHPEIPYFDAEHIIVGVAAAVVSNLLLVLLEIYLRQLDRAIDSIKRLEGLLPICSACKKIRDAENQWHVLEEFITSKTDATFTHGICPECAQELYPGYRKINSSKQDTRINANE